MCSFRELVCAYIFIFFCSWDRIVPESLILADTESNQRLKKSLAHVAKKVYVFVVIYVVQNPFYVYHTMIIFSAQETDRCCSGKNSVRKRKIEHILRKTFPHKRRFDITCFDSESSVDETVDEVR